MGKTHTATTIEGDIEHITYYNSYNHFTFVNNYGSGEFFGRITIYESKGCGFGILKN
jgi:hypothetical protein